MFIHNGLKWDAFMQHTGGVSLISQEQQGYSYAVLRSLRLNQNRNLIIFQSQKQNRDLAVGSGSGSVYKKTASNMSLID